MEPVYGAPTKYALYGDTTTWAGNIQESLDGAWYRVKDIDPLLRQLEAMGGTTQIPLFPEGDAIGSRPDYGTNYIPTKPVSWEQGGFVPESDTTPTLDLQFDGIDDIEPAVVPVRDDDADF